MESCSICYEPSTSSMIACQLCPATVCASCYIEYIKNLPFQNATLKCVNTACSNAHNLFGLSRSMNESDFECLMSCVNDKQRLRVEADTIKSQEEIQRKALMIGKHEKKVIETVDNISELLTPQCPKCNAKFDDFDGCFSIMCRSCDKNFCGWCLKFHGSSAKVHIHATHCTSKIGINHERSHHGTKEQFEFCFASKVAYKLNFSFDKDDQVFKDAISRLEVHLHRHRIYFADGDFHVERTIEYPNNHHPDVEIVQPRHEDIVERRRQELRRQEQLRERAERRRIEEQRLHDVNLRIAKSRDHLHKQMLIREAEERDPDPDNTKPSIRLCSLCITYARHDKRTCPRRQQAAQVEPIEIL